MKRQLGSSQDKHRLRFLGQTDRAERELVRAREYHANGDCQGAVASICDAEAELAAAMAEYKAMELPPTSFMRDELVRPGFVGDKIKVARKAIFEDCICANTHSASPRTRFDLLEIDGVKARRRRRR
jgi:hypothetical protein